MLKNRRWLFILRASVYRTSQAIKWLFPQFFGVKLTYVHTVAVVKWKKIHLYERRKTSGFQLSVWLPNPNSQSWHVQSNKNEPITYQREFTTRENASKTINFLLLNFWLVEKMARFFHPIGEVSTRLSIYTFTQKIAFSTVTYLVHTHSRTVY